MFFVELFQFMVNCLLLVGIVPFPTLSKVLCDVISIKPQLPQHRQVIQPWVDKACSNNLHQFFVIDAQAAREDFSAPQPRLDMLRVSPCIEVWTGLGQSTLSCDLAYRA